MDRSSAESVTTGRIALIGAATPSGTALRSVLEGRGVPGSRVDLYGITRGEVVLSEYAGEARLIQDPDPDEVGGHEVVFLCEVGEDVDRLLAGCREDALIVDMIGALDATEVTLIHAGLGASPLPGRGRVAVPHPLTIALVDLLHPIAAEIGLEEASAVALRPAADYGDAGVEELRGQVVGLLNFADPPRQVFGDQLAFNVLPQTRLPGIERNLERRIAGEVIRLLGLADGRIAVRLLTVPVFHGHGLSVRVVPRGRATTADLVRCIGEAGVVETPPVSAATPVEVTGERRSVLAEVVEDGAGGFWLWAVVGEAPLAAAEHGVQLAHAAGRL